MLRRLTPWPDWLAAPLVVAGAVACAPGVEDPEAAAAATGRSRASSLIASGTRAPERETDGAWRLRSAVDAKSLAERAPGGFVPLHRGVQVDVHDDGRALRVASARDGAPIRLTRLGPPAGPARVEGAAVTTETDAQANGAWVFAKPHSVEDLLVVHDLGAPLGYDVGLPPGWRLDRDHRHVVELVDPLGSPRLRFVAREAWDARGRAVQLALRVEGGRRVRVEVDAANAELPLYVDPEIQDTGTVAFPRVRNDLVVGQDARAYLVGGDPDEALPIEAFDPRTGRFDVLGPDLPARERSAAVVLRDGRIALIGGRRRVAGQWQALSALDVIDPRTGAVAESHELLEARAFHTVTRLQDGRLLIAGGEAYDAESVLPRASSELFDPELGTVGLGPPLSEPRSAATATRLVDGRVLVAGGGESAADGWGDPPSRSAELFDPETGEWALTTSQLVAARRRHAATLLHDGRVLLWGGVSTYSMLMPGEIYDPLTETFSDAGWRGWAPDQPSSQLMPSGQLFASGTTLDAAQGADPESEVFASYHAPAATLHDGTQLYVAGATAFLAPTAPAISSVQAPTYELPKRGQHAAVLLPSGRVALFGGRYVEENGLGYGSVDHFSQLQTVEIDPIAGTFEVTSSLARARVEPTATLLTNGNVLVVGGKSPGAADNRLCELYDPLTGTFSDTDATQTKREGHTATTLANGDVLIAGGTEQTLLERYVPSTGRFEPAGDLLTSRSGHTATLLLDGRVLIAGGQTALLELYDPTTNTSQPAGTMLQERTRHGAALLPDGRVLLAGNEIFGAGPHVAEVWDPVTQLTSPVPESEVADPTQLRELVVTWTGDVLFASGALYRHSTGTLVGAFQPTPDGQLRGWTMTPLLDGGALLSGHYTGAADDYLSRTFFKISLPSPNPLRAPRIGQYPPSASGGSVVSLGGDRLEGLTEGTSGHTLASSANQPSAVWLPLGGGTPALGTLTDFDASSASWHVPVTPFAGMGSLIIATGGLRSGGAPVFLSRPSPGVPCELSSECASDACVDGVCCDRACGPCESCSATLKQSGADGVCGPLPSGATPRLAGACPSEPLSTCGLTGACDGLGACAAFEEGVACLDGASCRSGTCVVDPPVCSGSQIVEGGVVVVDCAPYACTAALECHDRCESALDCAAGQVCSPSGECEAPGPAPVRDSGCSASGGASPLGGSAAALGLLLAAAWAARRRGRPGPTATLLSLGLLACTTRVVGDPPPNEGGAQGQGGVAPEGGGGEPPVVAVQCGNGVREPGEACDEDDLGGLTCQDLGLGGGPPRCTYDCQIDETSCASCGNGYVDPGEECDGEALPDETCLSVADPAWIAHLSEVAKGVPDPNDIVTGGLACHPDCTLDRSGCGYCFDGVISGDEVCDDPDSRFGPLPPNLGGATCQTLDPWLVGDELECGFNCRFFIQSSCDRPPPPVCAADINCSLVLGNAVLVLPPELTAPFRLDQGSLTIEYWARIDDPGSCQVGVVHGGFYLENPDLSGAGTWGLGQPATFDTVLVGAASASADDPIAALHEFGALALGQWYHVAGVIDGDAAQLSLYVNGSLVGSEPYSPAASAGPTSGLLVGSFCNSAFAANNVWGRIDELRVSRGARYAGVFTPEAVHEPDPATLALFHFDEGAGEVALDASGNGRHLVTPEGMVGPSPLWAGESP